MTKGILTESYQNPNRISLSLNPNITFWKKAYHRHTNFSQESIEIEQAEKTYVREDNETIFNFDIHRYADIINGAVLKINLPAIYSNTENYGEFIWNKKIGTCFIKYARLYIDDNLLEEIDGEYINIYNDMINNTDSDSIFNKMIGNINVINNPYTNSLVLNGYNISEKNSQYIVDNNISPDTGIPYNDLIYNVYNNVSPSIPRRQLLIPLCFCFFKNNLNMPLSAMRNSLIKIQIVLRPLNELYTVGLVKKQTLYNSNPSLLDTGTTTIAANNDFYKKTRIKNPFNNFFEKYTNNITNTYFNPSLEVNYIYLDNTERNFLLTDTLRKTVAIVKKHTIYNVENNIKFKLDINKPVKSILIMAQRTDMGLYNNWNNFTNNLDNLDPKIYQNIFFNLAKKEAIANGETDFIPYLGSFIANDSNDISLISDFQAEVTEIYEAQSNEVIRRYRNRGGIKSIKIINEGDSFFNNTLLDIHSYYGAKGVLVSTLKLKHIILEETGSGYLELPTVKFNNPCIDIKNNFKNTHIELQLTNKKVSYAGILQFGGGYIDNLDIIVLDTYNLSIVNIDNTGQKYISAPTIYIHNIVTSPIKFTTPVITPNMTNDKILSYNIINIGSNYNSEYIDYKIYIGGYITTASIIPVNIIPYDTTHILPSLHFYDPYNDLLIPQINHTFNNDKYLDISIESGYGFTQYSKLCVGKIIDTIILDKPIAGIVSNINIELAPKYYPKFNRASENNQPLLNYTTKPILDYTINNFTRGINAKFSLELETKIRLKGIPLVKTDDLGLIKSNLTNILVSLNETYNIINYKNDVILGIQNIVINEHSPPTRRQSGLFNNTTVHSKIINNTTLKIKINLDPSYIIFDSYTLFDIISEIHNNLVIILNYNSNLVYHNFNELRIPLVKVDKLKLKNDILDTEDIEIDIKLLHYTNTTSGSIDYSISTNITSHFEQIIIEVSYIKNSISHYVFKISPLDENHYKTLVKPGDTVSLILNGILIDTVVIMRYSDLVTSSDKIYGQGLSESILNIESSLYFGDFKENVFDIEFGKVLNQFKKAAQGGGGYGYTDNVGLYLDSFMNADLDLNYTVKNTGGTNITQAVLEPIIDYGGKDFDLNVEINYGGIGNNFKINTIYKNSVSMYTNVNGNINLNFNALNELIGVSLTNSTDPWAGFRDNPIYILKNTSVIYKESDIYADALIQGIIDYGGAGFTGLVRIDDGGFNGKLVFETNKTTNTVIKNISLYQAGLNYKDNISCYLVAYNKNNTMISKPKILKRFYLKSNQGYIESSKLYDSKNILDSSDYIDSILILPGIPGYNYTSTTATISITDTDYSYFTHYNFIIGGLIDLNITLINGGSDYVLNDGGCNIQFKLYNPLPQQNIFYDNYEEIKFTCNINNTAIDTISIIPSTLNIQDTYELPFVYYNTIDDSFHNIYPEITTKKELTGFTILDKGVNILTDIYTDLLMVSFLITDLNIINSGKLYIDKPILKITNSTNTNEYIQLDVILDFGGYGAVLEPIIKNGQVYKCNIIKGGKNYKTPPNIYILDDLGVNANITCVISEGTIVIVNILNIGNNYSNNTRILVGGEITNVSLNTDDKFKIINNNFYTISNKFHNTVDILTNKTENYLQFNVNYIKILLELGGYITGLNIINGGSNYTDIPEIIVLYKNNQNKLIRDFDFNTKNALGNSGYTINKGAISIKNTDLFIKIYDSKNIYKSVESYIVIGGEIDTLNINNNMGNILNNFNFISTDKVFFGGIINKITIIHPGNEIDIVENAIELVLLDGITNNIIQTNDYQENIITKGHNNNIRGNYYTLNVLGDGGGYGAKVNFVIQIGTGCKLSTLMGVDTITICDEGYNYKVGDKICIKNNSGICDKIGDDTSFRRWKSINQSYIIAAENCLNLDYIKNFFNKHKYNAEIRNITPQNIDFYTEKIINNIMIKFNNVIREEKHNTDIYGVLDKYYSNNNSQNKYKYLYTFEKKITQNKSKGYCNMASLNDIELDIDLKVPSKYTENFKYNVYIYTTYYNVIEFRYGKGYITFGN